MIFVLLSAFLLYLTFPNCFAFYGFHFLAWFFAVPLFFILEQKSWQQRLGIGFLWGILAYGITAGWFISYSLPGFLLFIFILSLQSMLFAGLFFPAQGNSRWDLVYVPGSWVVSEYLRSFLMRGLSWNIGHSQGFNGIFVQSADIAGAYGLSFLIILVNYCLYCLLRNKFRGRLLIVIICGVLMSLTAYGLISSRAQDDSVKSAGMVNACLVQPNIDFRDPQVMENVYSLIDKHLALSEACFKPGIPDLVIWPETSIPTDFRQYPELSEKIQNFVKQKKTPLLLGAALAKGDEDYNSAILVDPRSGADNVYHKRYLVPFTEYVPWGSLGAGIEKIFSSHSYRFSAGTTPGIFVLGPAKAGVMICSEDVLGGLYRQYAAAGANLIIVILNDSWFSQPAAVAIHLQQVIIHAVENRIPVIRVSNNGWSGFIDPSGRARSAGIKYCQQGVGVGKVYFYQEKTFYACFGDIFCFFCLGFVIIILIHKFLDRKRA